MSERDEMNCAELADMVTELALGVLTGRERATAVAHLDECETCREDVRQLMATGDQLLALLPPAEPPAGFETRVLGRLGLPAGQAPTVAAGDGGDPAYAAGTYPRLHVLHREA
ncbi:MAG: zf-HC2 domain-containing protein, partial [Trebonia sp.]